MTTCPVCKQRYEDNHIIVQRFVYKGVEVMPPVTCYTCHNQHCKAFTQTLTVDSIYERYAQEIKT